MYSIVKVFILVLALLLYNAVNPQGAPTRPRFNYTFQRFVVTWPKTFCEINTCRFGYNSWDQKSFVVHGLWPSSNDPGFVRQMMVGDDTCQSTQSFDARSLASINKELTKIMPGLARTPQSFWRYEYEKHGSCKVYLEKTAGSRTSEADLMKQYFEEIISLYSHTVGNFRPRTSTFAGTSGLARQLGINPAYISVTENNGNILQINFCMSQTKMNFRGRPSFIACPGAKHPQGTLTLPGFVRHHHLSEGSRSL